MKKLFLNTCVYVLPFRRMISVFVAVALFLGLLQGFSPTAFATDMIFNVGFDANDDIVAAMTGSSDVDNIELFGEGTVTLGASDMILGVITVKPNSGKTITISGGDFRSPVQISCTSDDGAVVLDSGMFSGVAVNKGNAKLQNSKVSNANHSPLTISGGSLRLENSTVKYTGNDYFNAISIEDDVSHIVINKDSLVTSTYCGIATSNTNTKTIGTISVEGNLHGSYRALSIGANTTITTLTADDEGEGHIFANGGAGIAVENAGGTIFNFSIEENAKVEGTMLGLSNINGGNIGTVHVKGLLGGVSNTYSTIDTLIVHSTGKIINENTAVKNWGSPGEDSLIGTINLQSGGRIWGKGVGSEGIGIANVSGTIQTISCAEGSYIEGGQSGSVNGYGIFNLYNNKSAVISSLDINGSVSGMDGVNTGGIGIYNRASVIESLTIGESGQVSGELYGVLNNYDQEKAEIKNFKLEGKIFSSGATLANSPNNDATKAVIGIESFAVDFYANGVFSLLRGKTDMGYVGNLPVAEIAPNITFDFSSDNKMLTISCTKEDGATPIYGLPVGLFCLDDGVYTRTGVTDANGKLVLDFADPFTTSGKTWWIYNFAHYDMPKNELYSSTKATVENVTPGGGDGEITLSNETTPTSVRVTFGGNEYQAQRQPDGSTYLITLPPGSDLSAIKLDIELPYRATISPDLSKPFDFASEGTRKFTITAEDGATTKNIYITITAPSAPSAERAILTVNASDCEVIYTADKDGKITVEIHISFASGVTPADLESLMLALKNNGLSGIKFAYVNADGTVVPYSASANKSTVKAPYLQITGTAPSVASLANESITSLSYKTKGSTTQYIQTFHGGLKLYEMNVTDNTQKESGNSSSGGCNAGASSAVLLAMGIVVLGLNKTGAKKK